MEELKKLLRVKSIVTLMLTAAFIVSVFCGDVDPALREVYLAVIAFYFGTQSTKRG